MNTASVVASVSRKAGGMFESVRRLHQSLAEIPGVNVAILGLEDEFTKADLILWQPLQVESFHTVGPARFGYSPSLGKRLREMEQDIVHTHGIWMYMSAATLSWHRAHHRPYMISPHGMLDPWAVRNSPWKKRLARVFYEDQHVRKAACLRALCQSEAESMRVLGLRNPICIIPNGIDLPIVVNGSELIPGVQVRKARKAGSKTLLYLGRIHPKKGLGNLLRAWSQVRRPGSKYQRSEEWTLTIAGWDQGGHERELKALAKELGIQFTDAGDAGREAVAAPQPRSLLFAGSLFGKDKEVAYRNCDAFILPSFSEGLPMAILEAWAHGKPVIMTPACNLPDGFTAQAALRIEASAESIAAGLQKLFEMSASELRVTGAHGLDLVRRRFRWSKIAAEMKGVYDWVLGGADRPECVSVFR